MSATDSRAGAALARTPGRPRPGAPSGDPPSALVGAVVGRPQLDASALLSVWEAGAGQSPTRRAVGLLTTAWPQPAPESWLHTSIGRRDDCLLTLREELFGDRLETVVTCPACGASLEIALRTSDVRVPAVSGPGDAVVRVEMDGYRVEGRPPTSADLIEVMDAAGTPAVPAQSPEASRRLTEQTFGGPQSSASDTLSATPNKPAQATGRARPGEPANQSASASVVLLRRCIRAARRGEADVDVAALPSAVIEAVVRAIADADPQADVRLALRCPDCGHRWSSPFDILSYLWDEIDDWATRLLQEVHALASAYGWSERDILGLSARRRRLYLEMCGARA